MNRKTWNAEPEIGINGLIKISKCSGLTELGTGVAYQLAAGNGSEWLLDCTEWCLRLNPKLLTASLDRLWTLVNGHLKTFCNQGGFSRYYWSKSPSAFDPFITFYWFARQRITAWPSNKILQLISIYSTILNTCHLILLISIHIDQHWRVNSLSTKWIFHNRIQQ
jgi:hypothetical protein